MTYHPRNKYKKELQLTKVAIFVWSDKLVQPDMAHHSILVTFAAVFNLVILLSVTTLSDGQLTFNPSAKTGEDWSLINQKRSPNEFVQFGNDDVYQKWQPKKRSKTGTPLIIELVLQQLERYSDKDYRDPENFMLVPSPTKLRKREQKTVSQSTSPEAKYNT